MRNFKLKLATASIGIILGGVTLAAQHPGNLDTSASGQSGTSNGGDRTAMLNGMAQHEFLVRTQECDTLKHDVNPNALSECMKAAQTARDSRISGEGMESNVAGRMDSGTQGGMANTPTGQSDQAGTQQKPEGNSVVDKVKNTVKETWADLTNKTPAPGESTSGTTGGNDSANAMKGQGQGMVLQGSGGVALFCQPISNMQH